MRIIETIHEENHHILFSTFLHRPTSIWKRKQKSITTIKGMIVRATGARRLGLSSDYLHYQKTMTKTREEYEQEAKKISFDLYNNQGFLAGDINAIITQLILLDLIKLLTTLTDNGKK